MKRVYFIGIGGIGVSALARFYLSNGWQVLGSDVCESDITKDLIKNGANIFIGKQKKENIKNYDLIIYSPAIKDDNSELKEAKEKEIKLMSYPQALGELTKEYFTIAISGTHGKSTTTAMLALILIKAGFDPTVIIGTKLKEFNNSNFRSGNSKYLLIEACEHEASFLNYWPQIIVITNIEEDHLDFYSNLDNIKKAFNEFVSHLDKDGVLIKRKDVNIEKKAVDFSLKDIEVEALRKIMRVPGDHNILNALAALKVARILEIEDNVSFGALSEYFGSWRRFEITKLPKFILIDDYAHHPTEIEATLRAVKEKYLDKKIFCVFQPHQYQRTKLLFNNFVSVFNKAIKEKWIDNLIFLQVYDVLGRETEDKTFDSKKLALNINNSKYINKQELFNQIQGAEVLIMMGAGDIYDLSEELKKSCKSC